MKDNVHRKFVHFYCLATRGSGVSSHNSLNTLQWSHPLEVVIKKHYLRCSSVQERLGGNGERDGVGFLLGRQRVRVSLYYIK